MTPDKNRGNLFDISEDSNTHPKPDKVTVMTWPLDNIRGNSFKEAISDTFTQKTGIPVHHIEYRGKNFPDSLWEALRKGERPPCDLIYGSVIPAMRLAKAGFCTLLNEEETPILKRLDNRGRPDMDTEDPWPFVNLYVGRYAIMYRNAAFIEGRPLTWNSLLQERFKGKVLLAQEGKGFFPIAQFMGGGDVSDIPEEMNRCWKFLRLLQPNIVKVGDDSRIKECIRKRKVDLVFTAFPDIRQYANEGMRISWFAPVEGVSDFVDSLVIPANLPDNATYWAKQFLVHSITREVQEDFCNRLGVCSMYPGIHPPEDLTGDFVCPKTPTDSDWLLFLPDWVTEEHEDDWIEKWNQMLADNPTL